MRITDQQQANLIHNLRQIHGLKHTKTSLACTFIGLAMELGLFIALVAYFIVDVSYSLTYLATLLMAAVFLHVVASYHRKKYGQIAYPPVTQEQMTTINHNPFDRSNGDQQ